MSENGATMIIEPSKEVAAVAKPAPAAPKLFLLVPKDLNEAMAFAKMVANSDFVPKAYVGKDGNCLIAMQYGAELGLPPLQAIQNIAVINGKPGIYGDLGKALLLSKGFKIEEDDVPEIKKNGRARCKVTRPNGEPAERTFSLEDAKTAGLWAKAGPWSTYPYRQMAWRAFWFAARDNAADVLKGIWGIEELSDYKADAIDTTTIAMAPKEIAPAGPSVIEKATSFVRNAIGKLTEHEPTPANPVVDVKAPPSNGLTQDQRKYVVALMGKFKVSPDQLKKHLFDKYGITEEAKPTTFVTQDKYAELCKWIEEGQDEIEFGV